MDDTAYQEAHRKLRAAFIDRLRNSVDAIDNIVAQRQLGSMTRDALLRSRHLSHGLAGSGTIFGFPGISEQGQKTDRFIDTILASLRPDDVLNNDQYAEFETYMTDLRKLCAATVEKEEGASPDIRFESPRPAVPMNDGRTSFLVLLVDDDKNLCDLLTLKLQQRNIRVVSAQDGDSALRILTRHKPDLIVLDVMIPVLNGHEMLRRLKQDPEYISIPIIMLTGQAQQKDVVNALHGGALDYIIKPVDPERLMGRIEKILDASRHSVLIADNDPLILQLLDSKFRNRGFKVRLVDNGQMAWEQIFKFLPDLVILDSMMPGLDGLAVLENMRKKNATRHIPVIILSARTQSRDKEDSQRLGAQAYMAKPFMPDELLAQGLKLLQDNGGS